MMPIDEAAEVLKKLLACRTELYCRTYCTECEYWDTHIRKISAIETAIAYLRKVDGCEGCRHLKDSDRFWVCQKCRRQYEDKYEEERRTDG